MIHLLNDNKDMLYLACGTSLATPNDLALTQVIYHSKTKSPFRHVSSSESLKQLVPAVNHWSSWLIMGLFLTACGGGGGSGLNVVDPADLPDETPGNPANIVRPIFADDAPDSFDLPENVTNITFARAVSVIGDNDISFSLDSASRSKGFSISNEGKISYINESYDFDTLPNDQKSIDVEVIATDNESRLSASYKLKVNITDVADAGPVFTGNASPSTDENNASFSHALPFTADLGGTVSLSLASGVDNDLFEIDSNDNLVVKAQTGESAAEAAARVLNHEDGATRTVTVTATDDSNTSLTSDQVMRVIIVCKADLAMIQLQAKVVTISL